MRLASPNCPWSEGFVNGAPVPNHSTVVHVVTEFEPADTGREPSQTSSVDAPPRRSLRGLAAWLGLGNGETLRGRVCVVSAHLDDAALSLGATIAHAARQGAAVEIVTVLAGDPSAPGPPGAWDEAARFTTAGEAVAARQEEDRRACELLGARPVWLPFWDQGYGLEPPESEVRASLAEALAGAETVLVPGWPLWHDDHRWVAEQALAAVGDGSRVGLYVEQPYAMWELRPAGPLASRPDDWRRLRGRFADRWRKHRAALAYATQLPLLGKGIVGRIERWEARRGGEHLAWL